MAATLYKRRADLEKRRLNAKWTADDLFATPEEREAARRELEETAAEMERLEAEKTAFEERLYDLGREGETS